MNIKTDIWYVDEPWCEEQDKGWSICVSKVVDCGLFIGTRTISVMFNTKPTSRQIRKVKKSAVKQLRR